MLSSLRKEILLVLIIKCILLYLLWHYFFSTPLKDSMTDKLMAAHFIQSSTEDNNHGH